MIGAQFKGAIFGSVAGAVCGAAIAGVLGGVAGAVLGVGIGVGLTYALQHVGNALGPVDPQQVQDKVYCYPRGRYAEGEFVRDMDNGRWVDIEQCSLCPDGKPDCNKDCLRLLNDIDRKASKPAEVAS